MSDKDVFLTSSSSGEEIPKWILNMIEKSGSTGEVKEEVKEEPSSLREVKEGSVLRFVFKEAAPAPVGSKGKGNESHDNKGRFTSKDKAVGPKGKVQAPESNKRQEAIGGDRSENLTQGMKAFDAEVWKAKGMMKAREEWKVLSRVEKDAMANPRETVQARVQELLSGVGAMPDTGNTKADIKARLEQIGDRMPEEARKLTETMISTLSDDLDAAGVERALARDMTLTALDHVAAQDIEAYSRTLGDHGVYHLNGDAVLAKDVLSVIPGNHNTPANRALMSLVAVYHDSGYLTPPSRSFLDSDHPRWSAQYFNENVAGSVEKAFGKDVAQLATQLIASHDHQGVNWEDEPELSAFSVADNFALFHKEKMPPMLRYVPANVKTLVDLAEKKLDLENAKAQMRKNIAASGLSKSVKAQFNSAVDEVSGVLPKFTLGMVGASLDKVKWNKDHLSINIKRRASNESLAKVLDMGYKQFAKLAETYGESPDTLIKKKRMELKTKDGRNLLEVTLQDILKKMVGLPSSWWGTSVKKSFGGFSPVFKFNPNHDELGRFAPKNKTNYLADDYQRERNKSLEGLSDAEIARKAIESVLTEEEQELYYSITNKLSKERASGKTTRAQYGRKGRNGRYYYTDDRAATHQKVLDKMFADVERFKPQPGEKPTFIILGGRGGSGKSQFESHEEHSVGIYDKEKAFVVDADEIKNLLAKEDGLDRIGDRAAAYHDESGDLVFLALARARRMGLNVVLDTTLKSRGERYLNRFKDAGYKTEVHFMELDKFESARRALLRWKNGKDGPYTGRLVPADYVISNHNNERNFDSLKAKADLWSFWDNNVRKGEQPNLIAAGQKRKKGEGFVVTTYRWLFW